MASIAADSLTMKLANALTDTQCCNRTCHACCVSATTSIVVASPSLSNSPQKDNFLYWV